MQGVDPALFVRKLCRHYERVEPPTNPDKGDQVGGVMKLG